MESIDEEEARVELATLILPQSAAGAGVQLGDGSEFVLEASAETIESASNPNQAVHIEGVVDLEKISNLVSGVTDEEFVEIIHHDAISAESMQAAESALEESAGPYLPEEEIPLVAVGQNITSSVVLSADPFVETLTKTVPSSTDASGTSVTLVDTTKNDNDDRLSHDAFLLSIPRETPEEGDEGGVEKLVLALPEIHRSETVSIHSDTTFPALVKRLSTLPTDVQHVELHATTTSVAALNAGDASNGGLQLDLVVERKVPVVGYVLLLAGLFALSSVGAALDLQIGEMSDTMKCFWRLNATSVALFPLALGSFEWEDIKGKLSWIEILVWFPLCACSYAFMTTAFIVALGMTSLANAFILSNLTSLIIILSKAVIGSPVLLFEGIGAVIGMFGALVCSAAHASSLSSDGKASRQQRILFIGAASSELLTHEMTGNLIAFLASIGTAIYLVIAKELRNKIDLFVFMFSLFTLSSLFLLVYMILSGEYVEFSLDPTYGIFGWMTPVADRLPLELYMAVVCNIVGTTGYIAVMKYFDPVVVSMVMLTEPVVAAFISVAVGVEDKLPGLQVWIGDIFVAFGSIMVIFSGSQKTESIDATSSLLTPKVTIAVPSTSSDMTATNPVATKTSLLTTSSLLLTKGQRVVWD